MFQFPHTRETFSPASAIIGVSNFNSRTHGKHCRTYMYGPQIEFQFPHTRETLPLTVQHAGSMVSIPAHTGNIHVEDPVADDYVSIPAHTGNIRERVHRQGYSFFNSRTHGKHNSSADDFIKNKFQFPHTRETSFDHGRIGDVRVSIPAHTGNITSGCSTHWYLMFQFPHTRETFFPVFPDFAVFFQFPHTRETWHRNPFCLRFHISIPAHTGNIQGLSKVTGALSFNSRTHGKHSGSQAVLYIGQFQFPHTRETLLTGRNKEHRVVSIPAHTGNIC